MKKKYQREVTQKVRKEERSFLRVCRLDHIHIAMKSRYFIWLLSYALHKDSLKKNTYQTEAQKLRKGEQSFFVWYTPA